MTDEAQRERPPADGFAPSQLYRTFVIRCWLEARKERSWRFSLLEVGSTNPRCAFTSPDELVSFLQDTMAAAEADQHAGIDRLVEVFQRAISDTAYRQTFKTDPVGVLAEAGLQVPEGITYQIVENTADHIHIVLPPLATDEELDSELTMPRAVQSTLLCAAGPSRANLIALIPGCNLAS